MLYLAYRELLRQGGRGLLSLLAIASAIAIVLLFEGFHAGILDRLHRFPASLPAQLVVVQQGVENFTMARSALRQMTRDDVEAIDGVKIAHPLLVLPVIFDHGGRSIPIQLLVHDEVGGTRSVVVGRNVNGKHQMVLDRRIARHSGIDVGTQVDLFGYKLEVVGLSGDSESPFAPYGFISFETLIDLYFNADLPMSPDSVSLLGALLVQLEDGESPHVVRAAIERTVLDVDVFTPDELGRSDAAMGDLLLGPALGLLIGIAWVIALLAIAVGNYGSVQARLQQYAVLKALGASPAALAIAVLATALTMTLVAIPLGLVLSRSVGEFVVAFSATWRPLPWQPEVVVRATIAALAATVLGVLPALRRLTRVEADAVLRGGVS
ncbi:MAG: ABC transporter permease [Myxococcales bacterium]|nr:ABC transporter permease [Myxococcales bacterium]MDD9968302.1 ABC transporter permease [Myxococcales bacterium]